MGQVVPVSSRPVDISMYCLGSIPVSTSTYLLCTSLSRLSPSSANMSHTNAFFLRQVLFPLFMQLDCPIKSTKNLQDAHLDIMQNTTYKQPQDQQSLAQILEFAANLLAKSIDLQNDMIDFEGFSILGLMFQWFSPLNWVSITNLIQPKKMLMFSTDHGSDPGTRQTRYTYKEWYEVTAS